MKTKRRDRRYWKIAPGEGGSLWVEQRDANCIALGWSDTGDLRNYKTIDELKRIFERMYPGNRPYQLWRFYKEVLPGHKIVASSGKFIYGIGTLFKHYKYDENLVYKHSKPVRWELTFWEPLNINELPISGNLKRRLNLNRTILELKKEEWNELEKALTENQNPFKNINNWEGLCLAPQTEQEVIILFSKLNFMLKMKIEYIGMKFPDAYIRIKQGKRWVTKSVEFEVYSSDFIKHGHLDKMKKEKIECDYIICWKDDVDINEKQKFKNFPRVIELRRVLEQIV